LETDSNVQQNARIFGDLAHSEYVESTEKEVRDQ
jgi:hypothetical protein